VALRVVCYFPRCQQQRWSKHTHKVSHASAPEPVRASHFTLFRLKPRCEGRTCLPGTLLVAMRTGSGRRQEPPPPIIIRRLSYISQEYCLLSEERNAVRDFKNQLILVFCTKGGGGAPRRAAASVTRHYRLFRY
jgi:hypothetical protein